MNKNYKQVEQQCSCCGERFSLLYWPDGTYTYLDDPCECQAEFFPLGPSILEWMEQLASGSDLYKSQEG